MWRCQVCNYLHQGDSPPEKCPKCGAPQEKFLQLEDEAAQLVVRSRFTNQLLMELSGLLEQAKEIAVEGIEDNLDPTCITLFKRLETEANILQQSLKAEINNHMAKGKWG